MNIFLEANKDHYYYYNHFFVKYYPYSVVQLDLVYLIISIALKFCAMHFIYQINRLTTTKVDSTYLG